MIHPLSWVAVLAVMTAVIFLLRGLRTLSWEFSMRFFVPLACLMSALAIFPGHVPQALAQSFSVLVVVSAALLLAIDFSMRTKQKVEKVFLTNNRMAQQLPAFLIEICTALEQLARRKTGALIIVQRKDQLTPHVHAGMAFDADVKAEILSAVFEKNSCP